MKTYYKITSKKVDGYLIPHIKKIEIPDQAVKFDSLVSMIGECFYVDKLNELTQDYSIAEDQLRAEKKRLIKLLS